MIEARSEDLTQAKDDALISWLGRPEANTLRDVVSGRMKAEAAAALNDSLNANEFEAKLDSANEHLRRAQCYSTFLKVLEEVTTDPRHQTFRLI